MKRLHKAILAWTLVFLTALTATAVPAKPGTMTMIQADGTPIEVRLVGDERAHQYFTPDGYLLVNVNEQFYYATVDESGRPVSTGLKAGAARNAEVESFLASVDRNAVRASLNAGLEKAAARGPRRGPGLFPESRFPGMGKQKALVILVEYKDVKMNLENPHDYFERMLNEENFSDYGGTGSARDFFLFNSVGQFDPEFDLYGSVTLSQNRSYYGGNDWYGDDQRPGHMVVEALEQLDDQIDFSEYDRDGDGEIDNVFIFYAGRGEASGGPSESVWPHSWTVTASGAGTHYFDGVLLDRYACSNEWEGSRPDGVGTFVHEFSHVMGLPDLYATSYTDSFTPGSWSAMDYGPYNNNGCTPPNYSAFERYAMGWLEPVRIDGAMNATLPDIAGNIAGIVEASPGSDEYFLFENRQQKGWDAYIPGHGMLVWHVDYNDYIWSSNTVNNTASHQYVDIEEADGTQSEYSRDGDSFPGTSGITSFTDDTRPSMRLWNGTGFGLPITDISEDNGIITFKVCGGAVEFSAPVLRQLAYDSESVTIGWDKESAADKDLIITVYENNPDVNLEVLYENYNAGREGTFTITGLKPQTEYVVTAYLRNGLQSSEMSEALAVFTGRPTLDRLAVVANEAEDISESSFMARWTMMEEATDYMLTVYERVFGAPFRDICGFDLGTDVLPDGWSVSSPATYANTAYSGATIPALRMGKYGDNIVTRTFGDDVRGVSFWHRGNRTTETDKLRVSLYDGVLWSGYSEHAIITDKGGATVSIDDIPAGYYAVRIEFVRASGKGAVAIDDVEVRHGVTYENKSVAGYENISTGNVEEYIVTGLKPETTYSYVVKATDGTRVSIPSEEIVVVTKPSSGVSAADVYGRMYVRADGSALTVTGIGDGALVTVYDLAGRTVGSAAASVDGTASVSVPASGVYIVRSGSKVVKAIVR